jgi:hypothetical protein
MARVALAAAVFATACSPPFTDITSTNTEDVGRYDVRAHVMGDELRAQVCVEAGGDTDEIADRVLHQLMNHSFRTIALDLFTAGRDQSADVTHVTWTREEGRRITGRETAASPCQQPTEGGTTHG